MAARIKAPINEPKQENVIKKCISLGRVEKYVAFSKEYIRNNRLKVTGHPFWGFAENRYCALKISPIFIIFSPNVRQCMQNMVKL